MASLRPLIGALALFALLAARSLPELAEDLVLSAASGLPGLELAGPGCVAPPFAGK